MAISALVRASLPRVPCLAVKALDVRLEGPLYDLRIEPKTCALCAHIWTAEFDNNHVKPALVTVQNGSAFQFLYAKGGGRYQFLQRPKHHVVLLLRQALTETSPTSIEEAVIEDGHLDIYANPNNYREATAWLVLKGEQNNQPLPLRIPLKSWDEGGEKRWTAPPLTAQFHAYKKSFHH